MTSYTVLNGDTLSKIAAKYGVALSSIVTANSLADANKITVGQVLIIPTAGGHGPIKRVTLDSGTKRPVDAVEDQDESDNIPTVTVTANRPAAQAIRAGIDMGEWLEPPKVYILIAAAIAGAYFLSSNDD